MTATILTILILAAPAAAHAHEATAGAHTHGETVVGYGWCLVAALITWSLIRARVRR